MPRPYRDTKDYPELYQGQRITELIQDTIRLALVIAGLLGLFAGILIVAIMSYIKG